jgi:thiamine-monophosphate kinase
VAIHLDVDRLPLEPAAAALFGDAKVREFALSGGEDYQLLFTVPEVRLAEVEAALAEEDHPTVIGRVTGLHRGGRVELAQGGRVVESAPSGYVAF